MKIFTTLVCALCLMGSAFSQTITDPLTQVSFKGDVWQIAVSETAGDNDWAREGSLSDLLALSLIDSKDKVHKFAHFSDDELQNLQAKPILSIPFLSCGVGYDYYKLIQAEDSYLLFQAVNTRDGEQGRVVVLNKIS